MAQTQTQAQVSQAVSLINQHKNKIREVFGSTPTGTSFDASQAKFSSGDQTRLQNELGLSQEQVQLIASVWPVYQMGYEDGGSR